MKTKHIALLLGCLFTGLIIYNFTLMREDVIISNITHRGCNVRFHVENKTRDNLKVIIAVDIASVNYRGIAKDVGGENFPIVLTPYEKKIIKKDIQCVHSGSMYDVRVMETSIIDTGNRG